MSEYYNQLSKDELISILRRRESQRKYGLVWERDEIEHEKALNDDFVVLEHQPTLSVGEEPWENLLIEGENFDALRYLRMTHKGRIKVIFIDPPYNTGNKDFIYNDNYVDKDDQFKHSKWLEFMYRRLTLARELLREDGVIFVNIGEEEYANLSLLMEQIFRGKKVGTFVWKRRIGASDEAGYNVSVDHEYVLCYANPEFSFAGSEKDLTKYSNPDGDERGPWMSADLTKAHTRIQRPNTYYPIQNPSNEIWYPCSPNNVWRFSSESRLRPGQRIRTKTMEQLIAEKKILFNEDDRWVIYDSIEELKEAIRNGTAPEVLSEDLPDLDFFVGKKIGYGRPRYKRHLSEMRRTMKPISTMLATATEKIPTDHETQYLKSGLTTEGTKLLRQIMGSRCFEYPKPLSLIKNLIAQSTSPDTEDIILDFFAGSGTTGHAVLSLNNEDDGNRKFILVSSTEQTEDEPDKNICRDVTQVRLRRVIEGYEYRANRRINKVEGLEGGFAYLICKRIDSESVQLEIRHEQVWLALLMIHNLPLSMYDHQADCQIIKTDNKAISYVSNITEDVIASIIEASRGRTMVVYSWQPGILRQRILSSNVTIEKIPEYLIERYGGQ